MSFTQGSVTCSNHSLCFLSFSVCPCLHSLFFISVFLDAFSPFSSGRPGTHHPVLACPILTELFLLTPPKCWDYGPTAPGSLFSFAVCEQFIRTSSTGEKNINSIYVYSLMRFVKTLMDPKPEHSQHSGRRHFAPSLPPAVPSHHAYCEYSYRIVACMILNFTQVRPDSIVSLCSWDSFTVLHVLDEHFRTVSQCMNTVYPVVCL